MIAARMVERGLEGCRTRRLDAVAAFELIEVRARDGHACGPRGALLLLDVELVDAHQACRIDFVLREMLARHQLEHVDSAGDLRTVNAAVVPIGRPVAAGD